MRDFSCERQLTSRRFAVASPTATLPVVLDLQLSDGDVSEVVAELAARKDRPNVVLISAASKAAMVAREHRVQFVAKPFELDQLVHALLVPTDEHPSDE